MTARAQWKKFAQRRILLSRGLDGKGAMNPEASQDMTATLRPEPRATAIRSEKERGSSISAVHFEQSAHQGSAGRVSACQEVFVVRDRIELSTFRFSGQPRQTLYRPAKTVLTDKRNRARRKVRRPR
jgi:hypothetical protein